MKKQTTIKIMVFAFMVAQLVCGTSQAATNSWNAGSGTWDTSTTSWFSPTTWTDGDSAIFTNRYDAVTVTVSGARTGDLIRVGSGFTNAAYYTLLGGVGVSIKANRFVAQFMNDPASSHLTVLTNLAMTISGKLAAGRGYMVLAGNTSVLADKFVTSDDGEFSGWGGSGDWGNLWLKDTATLRVINGIVVTRPNIIKLDGGTLYTPYLKISDLGSEATSTVLNGGRIVALSSAQNSDFIQYAFGNSAYVSTSGLVFDSDTNTITINKPLNHYTSGAATDGGLVKLGTGALTFSGVTNTYNGMTTVSNGTLVVSNMSALSAGHVTVVNTATVSLNSARSGGAITDSKNLYVNGGATVLIESNVNEVVYEFYIDGVIQNPGVWGRVGGGAAHESARIAGDGTLTVNHNPIPFVWNVTNGVWDTFTTNWLAGGTPSVWGGGLSDAIFTNGTSSRVVSVTNTQSAGSIRIGNNSNNCASYAFVNTSGSSLSASSVLIQGIYGAGPEGLTSFTNFNLTCAGDVGVGRRTLMIIGNSVMNVSRLVSSDFIGTSVGDCQWGSFTIQGNASVTASNGVALTSVNNLRLDGGLLSVPAVKVCDQNIAARMTFNGGRLVALVSTNDFLQLSSGVDSSFLPYGAYIAVGGAWIDTGTNTVTITKPLKHEGVPIDGGLIKLGAGLLTMTATNSYNGMTTVSNGTLRLAAFDNGVSSNGSVAVASGAFLDLAGFNQTVSNLMGGGSITNLAGGKTLTVTGTNTFTGTILGGGTTVVSGVMSPAGPGFIGQMTMNNTLILSGTLQVDVATNGTSASDLLVTQGTLDLTGAKLSVVNTNNLDVDKRYVVLTYSNAPTGAFNDSLLPLHWITQNDAVNNRILLRRESSGSLLMIQ